MPAWLAVIFAGPAKYRHCCFTHRLEKTASCAAGFLFVFVLFFCFSKLFFGVDTANVLGRGFEIIVAFKLLSTAILRCQFLLPPSLSVINVQLLRLLCPSLFSFLFIIETSAGKGLCSLSFHFFLNCCQNLQVHSLAIPVPFLYVEFVLVIFMCTLVESGIRTAKLFIRAGP